MYGRGRTAAIVIAAGAAAATLVACGSSGGGTSASAQGKGAVAAKATGGQSGIAMRNTSLGQILTSNGRTIYFLTADKPGHQACTGACFSLWPPVKVSGGPPNVGSGISATLGVTHGQLTINGHPAYNYSGDQAPGQTNGEGQTDFGGQWWALSPKGTPVTNSSGGSSSNSGGSSGGYGY